MTAYSFKDLLDEALALNDMSINSLATKLEVQRPWLQHALVGRRNLGYDNFEKIMSSLLVSEEMNIELRDAFAREYFGDTNFDIMKNAVNRLNHMANFETSVTPPPEIF